LDDGQGQPAHLFGSNLDITERKEAEDTLRLGTDATLRQHVRRARGDMVTIAVLSALVFLVSDHFDVFEWVSSWVLKYRYTALDDVVPALVFLAFAMVVYAFRRRRTLSVEVTVKDALRLLHGELGRRVRQRTGELSQANEALRVEVAERKLAADALTESQGTLSAIFDAAADGILLADTGTRRFRAANASICRMLGYSLEEMLNLSVSDIHPEEDLLPVVENFEKQAEGETGIALDLRMKRRDGSMFFADVNSTPVTLGGKVCLLGIFRDTAERKRTEARLLLLGAALDAAANEVVITDRDGTIQWVNPAFTKSTGYTQKEAVGTTRENWSSPASTTGRSTRICGTPSWTAGCGAGRLRTSSPSSRTSRRESCWQRSFSARKGWKAWARWPAAWPTT
jgi:PAS domain S-box-containing protein